MNKADELAVERASWAVAMKKEFEHFGFTYREHFNDYQTIFVVTHSRVPGWKSKLTICSAHNQRNRMEVERTLIYACKTPQRHKVIALFEAMISQRGADTAEAKQKEAQARSWLDRQAVEIGFLAELRGIDPEIIKGGPHEGCYCVNFQPGHRLEHLTLDEFKAFHAFVSYLK